MWGGGEAGKPHEHTFPTATGEAPTSEGSVYLHPCEGERHVRVGDADKGARGQAASPPPPPGPSPEGRKVFPRGGALGPSPSKLPQRASLSRKGGGERGRDPVRDQNKTRRRGRAGRDGSIARTLTRAVASPAGARTPPLSAAAGWLLSASLSRLLAPSAAF